MCIALVSLQHNHWAKTMVPPSRKICVGTPERCCRVVQAASAFILDLALWLVPRSSELHAHKQVPVSAMIVMSA